MSPMEGGSMPKPSEEAKAAFTRIVPAGPTVALRPMFGNLAAFVNGNMFAGLFGEELFVRLPDDESAKVREQGGRDFAPMAGRPMKGYVTLPSSWRAKPASAKVWIATALDLTGRMAPKASAAKKAGAKRPASTR
jgi:TfoX/Sxy family transcriptional regulator of competence genes